jgi:hypothetical protein
MRFSPSVGAVGRALGTQQNVAFAFPRQGAN